jgi:hypothetical protein
VEERGDVRDDRGWEGMEEAKPLVLELRVDFPAGRAVEARWGRSKGQGKGEGSVVRSYRVVKGDGTGDWKRGDFQERFINKDEVDQ